MTVLSFRQFADAIQKELGLPAGEDLSENTDLYETLGLDSLQTFELVYIAEELAGLSESEMATFEGPELEFQPLITIGDVYEYYVRVLATAPTS